MAINWKDPNKEHPEAGAVVAIAVCPNKEGWPFDVEILFGTVIDHSDLQGNLSISVTRHCKEIKGSQQFIFPQYPHSAIYAHRIYAWAHHHEFENPGFQDKKV